MKKDLKLPSSNKIVNINSKVFNKNITIKADKGYYVLNYYKDRNYFMDIQTFNKFIKATEKIVRISDEYKAYINYLKTEIGLTHCAMMSQISDDKEVTIEMHHGPILTLFDYCAIVLDSELAKGRKISTLKLAKIIIDEHYANNVQVVMLSKTAHQLVHTGKIFIHPKQAWGNLNNFLEKYSGGLTNEQIETINDYIELSKNNKSTDNGLFNVSQVANWNKNNTDLLDLDEEE